MIRSIKRMLERARKSPAYWTERAVLDFTSALWQVMQRRQCSQADLARKLEKNPAFVSRVLNGASNVTLRTMVEMAHALDARVRISVVEAERRPFLAPVTVICSNVPRVESAHVITTPLSFSAHRFAANDTEDARTVAA